ncbi:hypothetical protein PFISCL1PPCAC_18074, partial [Pristionchus fissidentatus]
ISIGSSSPIPTMSADYIEKMVAEDKTDNLIVTSFVDKPHWQIDFERYKECRQFKALIFSIKEPAIQKENKTYRQWVAEKFSVSKEKREKKGMQASMKEDCVEDMEKHPLFPAPYLIHISAERKLKTKGPVRGPMDKRFYNNPDASTGELQTACGVWAFSGLLKQPGDTFRVRVDAIYESMKEKGMRPHEFTLTVRVRSKRNLKIEHLNTASYPLKVCGDKYELVSKEIMGLFSRQFYDNFCRGCECMRKRHSRPWNMEPRKTENPVAFEEALILLLEMLHSGKVDRINVKNIGKLYKIAMRFGFQGIYSRLERHLIDICWETTLRDKLNTALLTADDNEMKEATDFLLTKYNTFEDLSNLYTSVKDAKISKYLLDQLFQVLREAQQQATVNSASHLYFRCDEHRKLIIQLNRTVLPKMVDLVIKDFYLLSLHYNSRHGPKYDWHGGALHSYTLADDRFFTGEEAGKESVPPAGTWAFILRKEKNGRSHFCLTKDRPTENTIYIGYGVKGRNNVKRGDIVKKAGVHYFALSARHTLSSS